MAILVFRKYYEFMHFSTGSHKSNITIYVFIGASIVIQLCIQQRTNRKFSRRCHRILRFAHMRGKIAKMDFIQHIFPSFYFIFLLKHYVFDLLLVLMVTVIVDDKCQAICRLEWGYGCVLGKIV